MAKIQMASPGTKYLAASLKMNGEWLGTKATSIYFQEETASQRERTIQDYKKVREKYKCILKDGRYSPASKSVAGSALSQTKKGKGK
jgi:hypothetical protein